MSNSNTRGESRNQSAQNSPRTWDEAALRYVWPLPAPLRALVLLTALIGWGVPEPARTALYKHFGESFGSANPTAAQTDTDPSHIPASLPPAGVVTIEGTVLAGDAAIGNTSLRWPGT